LNHIAAADLGFRGGLIEGVDRGYHHVGLLGGRHRAPAAPGQDATTDISLVALVDQPKLR
jgi:hypothetical protein